MGELKEVESVEIQGSNDIGRLRKLMKLAELRQDSQAFWQGRESSRQSLWGGILPSQNGYL